MNAPLFLSIFSLIISLNALCPPGPWRPSALDSNKCYMVVTTRKIWFEAEMFCQNSAPNSHLTSINSAYETFSLNGWCVADVGTFSFVNCPHGWNPSVIDATKCYLVGQATMTWQDAENYCQTSGPNSHLTSILSAFEANDINAILAQNSAIGSLDDVWLGAKGINGDEKFLWSDGNSFVYHNWLAGQPNLNFPCVSSLAKTTGRWSTDICEKKNYFVCKYIMAPTETPTDCSDYYFNNGNATDGIYRISPPSIVPFDAWCDMTTDGGGWTVFQKRTDEDLTFYDKTWVEYKNGFNNGSTSNLWLGNDKIHVLSTKDANIELRIDLWGNRVPNASNPNVYLYGKYESFSIDNEANYYTFHISRSSTGNASLSSTSLYYNNGKQFSTIDVSNDNWNAGNHNCSGVLRFGGWWLDACSSVSLNGKYIPSRWQYDGFVWDTGRARYNPAQSRMMLRKLGA